ncbi:type II secretion system F family protein [Ectobacillus sp. JY-23]|uniref:type II secretion system F family protein n=1 Tax=Ectobacillus sp. JY-23 TaxID=2933872 RepID=UPI001FF12B7B|nr:type II secretion system F family protein [Ectobacillus sp. JY-23]UOY92624.1 type II secretion system F family protein [Ectobacillus sp. JY-23]
MPQFQYVVRTKTGKRQTGKVSAVSKRDAYDRLRERELRVLEVKEAPETLLNKEITIGNPLKLRDFVIYLRQFATLLKAGVTVVDATRVLSGQAESKTLARTLQAIEDELRAGRALSEAYTMHKRLFAPMFISMVRAGEATGKLDESLESMANYYEKQLRTRQKIKSALSYPITVGLIAIIVVIFLLVKVVPTFVEMFEENNTELPLLTKLVLQSSGLMQQYWWIVIFMIIFLYINFSLIVRYKSSKYYYDYAIMRTPLIGKLIQKSVIARMTRTLSSLVTSAVPILQAISITEEVVNNEVVSRALRKSRESLQNGSTLSEPLKQSWVFPPLVTSMIAIGEKTGSLDYMLIKVADFYEAEVESAADGFKALIEPVMVVFLSGAVGVIVLAIMVPLFKLYSSM